MPRTGFDSVRLSFSGKSWSLENGSVLFGGRRSRNRVRFMAVANEFKMNLNEYMVTLDKPIGIRFAISVDGKVFVHALLKGVMVLFFDVCVVDLSCLLASSVSYC